MSGSGLVSAGLLMFRLRDEQVEVLLVHPGGPFFAHKDRGAWTVPKGLVEPGEDLLAAARRELTEETGLVAVEPFIVLGSVRQKSGKVVHAWAFEGDCDPSAIRSNTFELEWPRGSGKVARFPEVDRAAFFGPGEARDKINPAQAAFLDRLAAELAH